MIRSRSPSRSVSVCHSPWHPRGYRSLKFADLFQIIYVIRNKFFTIRSFIAVAYLVIDLNANRTFQLAQFKFRFRIVCTSRLWYYLPIYQAQITSIKLYKMPSSLSLSLSLRFIHSYHCCFDFISDQYNCSILFVLSVFYIFLAASSLIILSAIAFRVHDEISLITFRNYIILSRHLLYLSRSLFLSLSLCSPIRKVQINFCFPIITHRFIAHTYIDIQQHIDI